PSSLSVPLFAPSRSFRTFVARKIKKVQMRGADERRLRRSPATPQGGARRQRSTWAFFIVLSQLDFDVDARREVQLHQRIHGLWRRIHDIQQPLVGAHLELLAGGLVDV